MKTLIMSAHPVDIHVGKRLRLRRSMLGMSQDSLGKEIGVTFQQVQKYERGVNRIGSSRLYHLATILTVPVSFLFVEFEPKLEADMPGFAEGDGAAYHNDNLDSKETLALIRAYYKIEDPNIRKKVLSLIKAMGPVALEEAES